MLHPINLQITAFSSRSFYDAAMTFLSRHFFSRSATMASSS